APTRRPRLGGGRSTPHRMPGEGAGHQWSPEYRTTTREIGRSGASRASCQTGLLTISNVADRRFEDSRLRIAARPTHTQPCAMDPARRVGQWIVDLFAHPAGTAAGPMARVLNFFNAAANRRVADVLELRASQQVLELGFGGGAAISNT